MTFITMIAFQWFNILNVRSDKNSAFFNKKKNNILTIMMVLVLLLTFGAVYFEPLSNVLGTVSIGLLDFIWAFMVGSTILLIEEVRKVFVRRNTC